jgi:dihydropyrimidine dehydrogenase (NAD+) subunit PreT
LSSSAARLEQFPDLHPALDSQSALAEANRCLFCFDAPCTSACPTHIDVPRFIRKISTGNLRGSALAILDANILGLSCSRVCPVDVLCEGHCVLHRYNQKPIEIGRLQRFAVDRFYAAGGKLSVAEASGAPPVACVGGGPSSLACAAELTRRGHRAVILDNRALPGGLNTYGVAEYKLRPADSLREVDLVRSLGVEFRQSHVGVDVSLEDLERDYAFVFLGVGLGATEKLRIPGEDAPGVIDALRFIERYKTSPEFTIGRRVIVIGGGNTAIDAANAARRLGAEEVFVFYRRGAREMPAFPFEFDHSKLEGVRFHWLAQPTAIVVRGNRAAAVRFVETRLGEPGADGRRQVEPVAGSEYEIPCDLVIPALGQTRHMGDLLSQRGIEIRDGVVGVDRATGRTANPRYYAGGDCVNGGREVVDAVADGKRAAAAIARNLSGTRHA